ALVAARAGYFGEPGVRLRDVARPVRVLWCATRGLLGDAQCLGQDRAAGVEALGDHRLGEEPLRERLLPLVIDRVAGDEHARACDASIDEGVAARGVARGEHAAELDLRRCELVLEPALRWRLDDEACANLQGALVGL